MALSQQLLRCVEEAERILLSGNKGQALYNVPCGFLNLTARTGKVDTKEDLEASHPIVYYNGKPYGIIAVMQSGEQISATQFSKPCLDKVILTNGESVTLDQLSVIDGDTWSKVAERADNVKKERKEIGENEKSMESVHLRKIAYLCSRNLIYSAHSATM